MKKKHTLKSNRLQHNNLKIIGTLERQGTQGPQPKELSKYGHVVKSRNKKTLSSLCKRYDLILGKWDEKSYSVFGD